MRFTDRKSLTFDFTPTDKEIELYEKVSSYLQRDEVAAIKTTQRNLMILVYRKLLASSSFAIAGTIKKLIESLEQELKIRATEDKLKFEYQITFEEAEDSEKNEKSKINKENFSNEDILNTASMKMSILCAEKTKPVIDGDGLEINIRTLEYPVLLANIFKPASAGGTVSEWLEPRLNLVLEQWKSWQTNGCLIELDEALIKEAESAKIIKQKKKSKKDDRQLKLPPKNPVLGKKLRTVKSEVSISKGLDALFKKK